MNIYYFLASLAGASTIIIWLGKFIITKAVDVGIETYKAELVKDIEKHKSDLARITLEHQIKFSKLHEERAEKIRLLYTKIIEVEKALKYATTLFQGSEFSTDDKRDNDALNLIVSLMDMVDTERIYFSDSTLKKIEPLIKESSDIRNKMWNVRFNYKIYNELVKTHQSVPKDILDEMYKWKKIDERIETQFRVLKLELAKDFRALLGIS